MSFALFVQPLNFGNANISVDNMFITSRRVSASQWEEDGVQALVSMTEMHRRLSNLPVHTTYLDIAAENEALRRYADKGDALFVGHSVSFHNFTDEEGAIIRRVVVLYPMTKKHRNALPEDQLLQKILKAADGETIELIDLREHEKEDRALEGTGSIVFSPDGKFVYMARSAHSDEGILAELCSEDNLDIPEENRFIFDSAVPRRDGRTKDVSPAYHTSLLGWCGNGICAWAFDFLKFDDEEQEKRLRDHLAEQYDVVLTLSKDEMMAFASDVAEVRYRLEDDTERAVLCLSSAAEKALTEENRSALNDHYGKENMIVVYAEVLERRAGSSVGSVISMSITHGDMTPKAGEQTTLELAGIADSR